MIMQIFICQFSNIHHKDANVLSSSQHINFKILDKSQTCLLGSNRMVNVCIRKGSSGGSSGFTGRKDEKGTLTCHLYKQ